MNILSIDIDFIANNYADETAGGSSRPHIKWWQFKKNANLDQINTQVNYDNLSFLLDIFNHCANVKNKVMFAINHHSILMELNNIDDKFDIINIDHHHDILYHRDEIIDGEKFDVVNCGSWLWYLHFKNKINSYTWIKNKNSSIFNEGMTNSENPKNYKSFLKEELPFNIKDINFDFIFVCLSPEFILPEHWQYFHMLRNMYEQKIGKKVEYIQKVYEIDPRHLNFDSYKDIVIENNCCGKE